MQKTLSYTLLFALLLLTSTLYASETQKVDFTQEDREVMMRIEASMQAMVENFNTRFDQTFNTQFEQTERLLDTQFEQRMRSLWIFYGIIIAFNTAMIIAFAIWNRRFQNKMARPKTYSENPKILG